MHKSLLKRCDNGEVGPKAQYVYNIGLILSQILSVILGGDPDETISSRTGKASQAGLPWFEKVQEPFINFMFQDENHCAEAIEVDEGCKEIWHWVKL